jgi:hypothetical protein
MIVLSIGGLATSVQGLTMGITRLRPRRQLASRAAAVRSAIPAPSADMPAARTMNG